jgi:pseudouridine-5'-monophosphatase
MSKLLSWGNVLTLPFRVFPNGRQTDCSRWLAARVSAAHLLSSYPDVPLTIDSFLAQSDIAQHHLWPTVEPLPGALRLVRHLYAHGIPIAIATGGRRFKFLSKTKHLQDLFACFEGKAVCADDFPGLMRGKPEPDMFLMAAKERLGFAVGNVQGSCTDEEKKVRAKGLVFEDGLAGIQGGKRAGMNGAFKLFAS